MERRRPAFLRRTAANEERRRRQIASESTAQGSAFRWAAVGVAFVLAIAVMAGFTDYGQALAGRLGGLGWLQEPAIFGIAWGDVLVVALVGLAVALFLWRDARRIRRSASRR